MTKREALDGRALHLFSPPSTGELYIFSPLPSRAREGICGILPSRAREGKERGL